MLEKKEPTYLQDVESLFYRACFSQNISMMALYGGQYIMYSKCLAVEAEDELKSGLKIQEESNGSSKDDNIGNGHTVQGFNKGI